MTPGTAARRYARALFDVVLQKQGDLDRTASELDAFQTLVASHPTLASALANPSVPAAKKRAVVEAILTEAGPVSESVGRTLVLLADRDRLPLLPAVARAFRARLMDHRQIVHADVTTAVPLDAGRVEALATALGQATGRTVTIDTHVDAGLLGGVVARVGSVVYDGSVARQLEKMKEQLVTSGQ